MSRISFKKNLNFLIKNNSLTLLDLQKATKIKKDTLNNYQFSSVLPSYENLIKLADFFGISIDYLLVHSKNKFINFSKLFYLAERTNNLQSTWRNHIEESIAPFLKKGAILKSIFDSRNNYFFTKSIHSNIKEIRKKNNLTQEQLAKVLSLKSRVSVALYEKKSRPPYDILYKISLKYNISMQFLITGKPLIFEIEDNLLLKNLFLLDRDTDYSEVNILIPPIKKILENNNLLTEK